MQARAGRGRLAPPADCQLRQIALASTLHERRTGPTRGPDRIYRPMRMKAPAPWAAGTWERNMDAVYYIAPTVAMTAYAMLMGVVLMG